MIKSERERQKLIDALTQVACRVNSEISRGLERQQIQPEEDTFYRKKVNKIQYTDHGIKGFSVDWQEIPATSWQSASRNIEQSVRKSEEYLSAKKIRILKKRDQQERTLDQFINHLVSFRLYQSKLNDIDIRRSIATFIKDLEQDPVNCRVKVGLEGIVLKSEDLRVRSDGVTYILRKTRPADLEKECIGCQALTKLGRLPMAFLEFDLVSRSHEDIRRKVEQVLAVLRLFKGAAVQCHSYHTEFDSIADHNSFGYFHSSPVFKPVGRGAISSGDVEKLKKFWMKIAKVMPSSFYQGQDSEIDCMFIAYNRYYTALLQEGIFERKVLNALMGLEGLYLRSEESHDLYFRLCLRLAKVADGLGFDPYLAKAIIEDAYYIKKCFAHGELLLNREKRKLLAKYKKENFFETLIGYLRVSLVLMMVTFREKDSFLNLVDDSFVDRQRAAQLEHLLSSSKKYIF